MVLFKLVLFKRFETIVVGVQGSVGTSLVTAFGWRWLYAGLMHLLSCSFQFAGPLLQRAFLQSIPSTQPHSRAIVLFWAVVMSLCSVVSTIFRGQVLLSSPLPPPTGLCLSSTSGVDHSCCLNTAVSCVCCANPFHR